MAAGAVPSEDYATKEAGPIRLSEFGGISATALITGRHGTEKTTLLLNRIQVLLESGTDPEGILIVCASAFSEQDFRLALGERFGSDTRLPQVLNARQLAFDVLSDDEAVTQTGRPGFCRRLPAF
jgi:hypothetical protein